MNFWQKASLITLVITSVFWPSQIIQAADCPFLPQTAYKSPDNPAVYYLNRNCTKRPFTSETAFFAYFSSWKQVKITTSALLESVPNDPKGPMTYRLSIDPIAPSVTVPTPTKPKVEPISQAPVVTPVTPVVTPVVTPAVPATNQNNAFAEFLRCPTDIERANLDRDFNFVWSKDWENFPFDCNYSSLQPSRLSVYTTVRLLANLNFSKPLPFTNGQSLTTYLTAQKLTIQTSQDCTLNSSAWNYVIYPGGIFSRTYAVKSGSATCEFSKASPNERLTDFVYNPIYKAGTFVHEAHHAINASTHPNSNGSDKSITDNSGWAAQFYFYAWINLYSDVDQNTRSLAKGAALNIINNRFSENKCPTDPELKNVVNQIAGNICL